MMKFWCELFHKRISLPLPGGVYRCLSCGRIKDVPWKSEDLQLNDALVRATKMRAHFPQSSENTVLK